MIISRAPLNVSFAGDGSDFQSFYEKYGGCIISAAIQKYCYVAINKAFTDGSITLKYSKTESVTDFEQIKNPIFHETLKDFGINGIEISAMTDMPFETGLGFPSAFTIALLRLLYAWNGKDVSSYKLAKYACDIEINRLGYPIGKQNQFATSFGGLRYYEFCPDGFVKIEPIIMKKESLIRLENNILVFYTGETVRKHFLSSSETENLDECNEKTNGLRKACVLTRELKKEFENNNIDALGPFLSRNWNIQTSLSGDAKGQFANEIYELGISGGSTGGKFLGADGNFVLFYCPDEKSKNGVRHNLSKFRELPFILENAGCSIIFNE
jgi:D-glycero-alpha-D-manno-heptose-7-phosphate kinase